MGSITIEQLIDIVQADLTISGLLPRVLPDMEIYRLVKEHCLEWFYKNYQFAVQKMYYYINKSCFTTEQYTQFKYFILPEEIENVVRILKVNDRDSALNVGIQAPNLSINLGVTNQPFLTSFVTTAGELGVYRSILGAFADELNKMHRNYVKYDYNHISKRLNILTDDHNNLILEVYSRIPQDELFDFQLFKDYTVGYSKIRLSEAVSRFNFTLPGNFNYQADTIKTEGERLLTEVKEKIKGETNTGWFKMSL